MPLASTAFGRHLLGAAAVANSNDAGLGLGIGSDGHFDTRGASRGALRENLFGMAFWRLLA